MSKSGPNHAASELFPLVYGELRKVARNYLGRERAEHTLQPTALVNEAWLRLRDQRRVDWQGRTHVLAVGAQAMRRVLIDHGRRQKAKKRGGPRSRVTLDEQLAPAVPRQVDLLALDEALDALAVLDEQKARIVELRAFGGLEVEETAEALGISPATVKRHWAFALAWLQQRLREERSESR